MGKPLKPDLKQAAKFLDALEPGGDFWFQTAAEPRGSPNGSTKVVHGTLPEVADQLIQLNQNGSAIWVQINAGKGRKDVDVTRIRAYFVDLDGVPSEPLFQSAVPADVIVESSPGKFHGYWMTQNAPLDEYVPRMQALAAKFGGDMAVCNLGRVMRLPGFFHLKDAPFKSRIVHSRKGG